MYSYDIDASDIDRYVEAPFNCIMSYRVPSNEQMDYFQRKGIRAIIGFSNYFYTLAKQFESIDDEYDFYTNSINRLKGHPSTLAWYLHDEIPLSFMPRLLERQRLAHLLDPEHPTWGILEAIFGPTPLRAEVRNLYIPSSSVGSSRSKYSKTSCLPKSL